MMNDLANRGSVTDAAFRPAGGKIRGFLRDERGQAATEYILVIGLIIIPIAIVFNNLQNPLKSLLDRLAKGFRGPGV